MTTYAMNFLNLSTHSFTIDGSGFDMALADTDTSTPGQVLGNPTTGQTMSVESNFTLTGVGDFHCAWYCAELGYRFAVRIHLPAQIGVFGTAPYWYYAEDTACHPAPLTWKRVGSDPARGCTLTGCSALEIDFSPTADHTSLTVDVSVSTPAPVVPAKPTTPATGVPATIS